MYEPGKLLKMKWTGEVCLVLRRLTRDDFTSYFVLMNGEKCWWGDVLLEEV